VTAIALLFALRRRAAIRRSSIYSRQLILY
jgi:hypothetical protein